MGLILAETVFHNCATAGQLSLAIPGEPVFAQLSEENVDLVSWTVVPQS